MVHVELQDTINGSADEVWELVGTNFANLDWSTQIAKCRPMSADEVPKKFKVDDGAPIPGRAVPNPLGGETKEVLTKFSDDEKIFTFSVSYPFPVVSLAENTTKVIADTDTTCTVIMELDMTVLPLFCCIGPVLESRLQTSLKGPAGVLADVKAYFDKKNPPAPEAPMN